MSGLQEKSLAFPEELTSRTVSCSYSYKSPLWPGWCQLLFC